MTVSVGMSSYLRVLINSLRGRWFFNLGRHFIGEGSGSRDLSGCLSTVLIVPEGLAQNPSQLFNKVFLFFFLFNRYKTSQDECFGHGFLRASESRSVQKMTQCSH